MLKQKQLDDVRGLERQPPSGGCVLKPVYQGGIRKDAPPAAFRRLCVETRQMAVGSVLADPAAFRRLCVETLIEFNRKTCF